MLQYKIIYSKAGETALEGLPKEYHFAGHTFTGGRGQ